MLYRSYQESTSSGSDDRKEFILKLLSQDPSNYADAPTGKHRLISLHLWNPEQTRLMMGCFLTPDTLVNLEGIRRALEKRLGRSVPRGQPLPTSKIGQTSF
jgi:hypothetical protein